MKTYKFFLIGLSAMGLSLISCQKVEQTVPEEVPTGFTISIPASFDDPTKAVDINGTTSVAKFLSTDKIYAYNNTTGAMLEGYLTPSNISAGSCTLTGELSGSVAAGNVLRLFYNLTDAHPSNVYFGYAGQNGIAGNLKDFAEASITLKSGEGGTLTSTEPASFTNLQSLFRFSFTCNSSPINVKSLVINSRSLIRNRFPLDGDMTHGDYQIELENATTGYIYVALAIDEEISNGVNENMVFTVIDNNGTYYSGKKTAPSSGFKNNKYYYNSEPISLAETSKIEPMLSWTKNYSVGRDDPSNPDQFGIDYTGDEGFGALTISGTSRGYSFWPGRSGINIYLENLNAGSGNWFIGNSSYCSTSFNLIVKGNNCITCDLVSECIGTLGTLKIEGNGMLTLIFKTNSFYGIYASNYNTSITDVNNLAAEGYTVTRSAETESAGLKCVTYSVSPKSSQP